MKYVRACLGLLVAVGRGLPLRFVELMGQLLPENSAGCMIRGAMLRPFLKRCGRNFQVGLSVKLEHLGSIEVGDNVYIGHGCWISGLRGGIQFSDEVMLGPYVTMVSSDHRFENGSARFATGVGGTIRIGRGTWLGAQSVVTANTRIGDACLVAAGAVVTKDVADGAVVAGVPARVIASTASEDAIDS